MSITRATRLEIRIQHCGSLLPRRVHAFCHALKAKLLARRPTMRGMRILTEAKDLMIDDAKKQCELLFSDALTIEVIALTEEEGKYSFASILIDPDAIACDACMEIRGFDDYRIDIPLILEIALDRAKSWVEFEKVVLAEARDLLIPPHRSDDSSAWNPSDRSCVLKCLEMIRHLAAAHDRLH